MPYYIANLNYPVGGATVEWFSWIIGFKDNGWVVKVLSSQRAEERISTNTNTDTDIDIEIIYTYKVNKGISILRWFYYRIPVILKSVISSRPDVIVQECASLNTAIMAFVAKVLKIPFVYRVANDIDSDDRIKQRLSRFDKFLYSRAIKTANAIVCQNNYQLANFQQLFKSGKRICKIHNPIQLNKETMVVPKSERKYISWIGVFQKQKNLPVLLEIANKMPSILFKVAGKKQTGLSDKTTIDALEELRKCKNVQFVGYLQRDEIPPFLRNSLLLLNTSFYEGFSNTYLEAFSSGTPVVTTKFSNPDSLINQNNIGFVATTHSELCSCIKQILEMEPQEYLTTCLRARAYIEKNHNPKLLAKEFIKVIEEICE